MQKKLIDIDGLISRMNDSAPEQLHKITTRQNQAIKRLSMMDCFDTAVLIVHHITKRFALKLLIQEMSH